MNKDEQIAEALNWLKTTGQTMVDFTAEQAPLYCQEVLNWSFYTSLVSGVICLLIAFSGVFLIKPVKKAWDDHSNEAIAIFGPIWIICCMFFLAIGISDISHAAKCKIAPRMVIIEHFQNTLK